MKSSEDNTNDKTKVMLTITFLLVWSFSISFLFVFTSKDTARDKRISQAINTGNSLISFYYTNKGKFRERLEINNAKKLTENLYFSEETNYFIKIFVHQENIYFAVFWPKEKGRDSYLFSSFSERKINMPRILPYEIKSFFSRDNGPQIEDIFLGHPWNSPIHPQWCHIIQLYHRI